MELTSTMYAHKNDDYARTLRIALKELKLEIYQKPQTLLHTSKSHWWGRLVLYRRGIQGTYFNHFRLEANLRSVGDLTALLISGIEQGICDPGPGLSCEPVDCTLNVLQPLFQAVK